MRVRDAHAQDEIARLSRALTGLRQHDIADLGARPRDDQAQQSGTERGDKVGESDHGRPLVQRTTTSLRMMRILHHPFVPVAQAPRRS
jgi:hypothetical protein